MRLWIYPSQSKQMTKMNYVNMILPYLDSMLCNSSSKEVRLVPTLLNFQKIVEVEFLQQNFLFLTNQLEYHCSDKILCLFNFCLASASMLHFDGTIEIVVTSANLICKMCSCYIPKYSEIFDKSSLDVIRHFLSIKTLLELPQFNC